MRETLYAASINNYRPCRDFRADANFRDEGKTRIARELDMRDPRPFHGNRYIMFRLNCGFEPQLSRLARQGDGVVAAGCDTLLIASRFTIQICQTQIGRPSLAHTS